MSVSVGPCVRLFVRHSANAVISECNDSFVLAVLPVRLYDGLFVFVLVFNLVCTGVCVVYLVPVFVYVDITIYLQN